MHSVTDGMFSDPVEHAAAYSIRGMLHERDLTDVSTSTALLMGFLGIDRSVVLGVSVLSRSWKQLCSFYAYTNPGILTRFELVMDGWIWMWMDIYHA